MKAPIIYRNTIFEIEAMLGLMFVPLRDKRECLLYHAQLPNAHDRKVAIHFCDEKGEGFDVFDLECNLEYVNIPGQFPDTIGPANIKNKESLYPIVDSMKMFSKRFHA